MPPPSTLLAILRSVRLSAILVDCGIDIALDLDLEHEAAQALRELRKGIESVNSNITVYKALLSAIEKDTDLDESSRYVMELRSRSYALQYHRQGGTKATESFERVLKETLSLLQGKYDEATMGTSGSKKPRRYFGLMVNLLNDNPRPGHGQKLLGEISVCQQNNERAFKLVWYNFVTAQNWPSRPISLHKTRIIQDRVGFALNSLLEAFHVHPFAVSPESLRQPDVPTFAILNRNHAAATRNEVFARQIGKTWVDDRHVPAESYLDILGPIALRKSLFELIWSGTVDQLKRHRAYTSDDPERPEFEKALEGLERALQEEIVPMKEQNFTIAFCGTVEANTSLLLNAFMGRSILPSDGEPDDSRTAHPTLSITTELLSTALPCRLRHVEGQTVPQLRFQAKPFLVVLKELQAHQYGWQMRAYQSPPGKMVGALYPSEPSDEGNLLSQ
jgi:hypothetical protein